MLKFFSYIAVEAYEATMKIIGGNFSTFTPALENKTSPEYKKLAKEIITSVRTEQALLPE